jgi:hypothetical protein
MKRFLFIFSLLFFTITKLIAQTYNQYNTGTLFDSFENPSQKTFTPDSSREYASNFFVPNIDANFYITGDAQQTLKNRYFNGYYKNNLLKIEPGTNYNHINVNANAYILMLKIYGSLNGDSEFGFFVQTKANSKGAITDGAVALFNGSASFPNNSYANIFNSNYNYQAYGQAGFTYREQVTKQFAFGFKLAYVTGLYDTKVQINQSGINFIGRDTANLHLAGTYRKTANININPFLDPGVSVSIGTTYKTDDGFIIQGNVKDLGFIYWNDLTRIYNFNGSTTITGLTTPERENNVYHSYIRLMHNGVRTSITYRTPLDGSAELSASKLFWLGDDNIISYSPTLIASKELFYNGFTGVLVNPINYKNYTATISTSLDDMKLFNIGAQFMIKSPNNEFFIGTDKLLQSGSLAVADLFNSQTQINKTGSFTGADLYVGFSIKFGSVIEHPMNSSNIPMGDDDKGFLGRLWDKVFHRDAGIIQNN